MYFWRTRTQHKPNLGLKLAPSWPQDGPKMAQVDTKMAYAGPSWPMLAHVGPKLFEINPKVAQVGPNLGPN